MWPYYFQMNFSTSVLNPSPSSFTCPWSMFSFSSPQINLSLNLFPLKCQSPFTLQPITFPKLPSLLFFFSVYGVTVYSVSQAQNFAIIFKSLSSISSWSSRLVTSWIVFQKHLVNTFLCCLFSSLFWLRPRSSSWTIATITRHFFLPGIFHSAAQTSTPAPPCHHQDYLSEIWIQLGHSSAQTLTLHCL